MEVAIAVQVTGAAEAVSEEVAVMEAEAGVVVAALEAVAGGAAEEEDVN